MAAFGLFDELCWKYYERTGTEAAQIQSNPALVDALHEEMVGMKRLPGSSMVFRGIPIFLNRACPPGTAYAMPTINDCLADW